MEFHRVEPEGDGSVYDLSEEEARPEDPDRAGRPSIPKICAVCDLPVTDDACPGCGFDPSVGLVSSRRMRKKKIDGEKRVICSSCGHDLSGNVNRRCPECGQTEPTAQEHSIREEQRWHTRASIMPSVVWGSLGLIGAVALTASMSDASFLGSVIVTLVAFVLAAGAVFGAHMALGYLWYGVDEAWWVCLVKSGAITAGALLLLSLPVVGMFVFFFGIFAGALLLFDLEVVEAIVFSFVAMFLVGLFVFVMSAIYVSMTT